MPGLFYTQPTQPLRLLPLPRGVWRWRWTHKMKRGKRRVVPSIPPRGGRGTDLERSRHPSALGAFPGGSRSSREPQTCQGECLKLPGALHGWGERLEPPGAPDVSAPCREPLLHQGFIGGPGPHVIPLQTAAGGLSACIWLSPVAGGAISHEKTA